MMLALLLGCPDPEPTPPPTPVPPITLEGTLTYTDHIVGYGPAGDIDRTCVATYEIRGVEAEGCELCDWLFELTSTELTDDCDDLDPEPTLQGTLEGDTLYVAAWTDLTLDHAIGTPDAADPFLNFDVTFGLDGDQADDPEGGFTASGSEMAWSHSWGPRAFTGPAVLPNGCAGLGEVLPAGAPGPGTPESQTLPCTGGIADAWTFDADAGVPVTISLDLPTAAGAFDPTVLVVNESGCLVDPVPDAVDCSIGGACPAAVFTPATSGEYRVIVHAEPVDDGEIVECAGTTGSYTLAIDGATTTPVLTDDVQRYERLTTSLATIEVTATVSEPL